MIEITIPMTLPVRKVVPDKPEATRPEWHREEFTRLNLESAKPAMSAIHREHQSVRKLRIELEQERERLRGERVELAKSLIELQRVAREADVNLNSLLGEIREVTIELAHAIASKLVFEQLDEGRFPISNLVHEMMDRVPAREAVMIRLHPEDLAKLEEDSTFRGTGDERVVQYIADATLCRGDCKASAGEIKVVYQLRHQVEEIRRQLLSTVSGHDEIGT